MNENNEYNEYNRLFSRFEAPAPRAGLHSRIMGAIARFERRRLFEKIVAFAVLFVISFAAVFEGASLFLSQLSQSGFTQFAGLFFSDFSATVANLPDFFLSLIESFPIFSAALLLGGILIAIVAVAGLASEAMAFYGGRHKFS